MLESEKKEKYNMGKVELEVKVLDIDEKKLINKIKQLGGTLIEESNQFLYTYDLSTIYGRYVNLLYKRIEILRYKIV